MTVCKKGKRKIVYEDQNYYWHIAPDYDRAELRHNFNILHIVAEDKTLELHIALEWIDPVPETVTPQMVKDIIAASEMRVNGDGSQ